MKRTKSELIQVCQATYVQPGKRCATCKNFSEFSNNCFAVTIREQVVSFRCDPSGLCDLHEERAAK